MSLTEQILAGNRRAIARLITQIENKQPEAQTILAEIYPHTGRAHLVGVTGAPGTGKSSLVNQLVKAYRRQAQPKAVAILAVDPTSPFSGGAILGDRIRMRELAGDPGVFIRSMASRDSRGGLAQAVDDALKVLDAAGFGLIFIETVGAGQSEVEIAKTAQTIIVVEAPGLGDDIQAIKAGILEIADIFVVNKADRAGAERAVATLKMMLELGRTQTRPRLHHGRLMTLAEARPVSAETDQTRPGWEIPVLKTVAIKAEGIDEVVSAIERHFGHLTSSGELDRRDRVRLVEELESVLQAELSKRFFEQISPEILADITDQLTARRLTPYQAVQILLKSVIGN
jgi:LAO/AO transport system kinase